MAPGQGRIVGRRPAPRLAAVGQPRPGAFGDRRGGLGDVTHLVLHHEDRVTSTVTVTLNVPMRAGLAELYLWGEAGRSVAPVETAQPVVALRTALTELAA